GAFPAPQPVPGPQSWTPPPGATPPGAIRPGIAPGTTPPATPGLSSKGKLLIWVAGAAVIVIVVAVFGVSLALTANQQAGEEGERPGTQAALFENSSPVAIEDQATVESTIEVTGVEGYA